MMTMSRRLLSYNDHTPAFTGLYGNITYIDNKTDIKNMKKLMNTALTVELTEKQRYCILEYYCNQRKMKDIALDMNVSPSTVTRHIERGMKKLERIATHYYQKPIS